MVQMTMGWRIKSRHYTITGLDTYSSEILPGFCSKKFTATAYRVETFFLAQSQKRKCEGGYFCLLAHPADYKAFLWTSLDSTGFSPAESARLMRVKHHPYYRSTKTGRIS